MTTENFSLLKDLVETQRELIETLKKNTQMKSEMTELKRSIAHTDGIVRQILVKTSLSLEHGNLDFSLEEKGHS